MDTNWIVAISTLLSPLIALQISKKLENRKNNRADKLRVFATLMSTRATMLDVRHVEALNLIDVIFCRKNKKEKEIRSKWKEYLDHLTSSQANGELWASKRLDLFVELMYSMALDLDYDMDKSHIKNQCYYPVGHGDNEEEQAKLRKSILKVFSGEETFKVEIQSN